jgi:hypothetical protein
MIPGTEEAAQKSLFDLLPIKKLVVPESLWKSREDAEER